MSDIYNGLHKLKKIGTLYVINRHCSEVSGVERNHILLSKYPYPVRIETY